MRRHLYSEKTLLDELIKSVENLFLEDNRISFRKVENFVPAFENRIKSVTDHLNFTKTVKSVSSNSLNTGLK